ncbi:MAG: AAC(3) family N-acetyltransferase [Magnetococcales bacterium]|nr:AAC(3) family N-acetyltransferase [Magnetococcales bacterium]NGZ06268.1 AAC(3) family N-acetyltransferase [Magnetococcales bacterium]
MIRAWLRSARRDLKGVWKKKRLIWLRRWRGFGPEELHTQLVNLGIQPGDVVMVHSSLDRLEAFTGKSSELLTVLQSCVGEQGLLLMPTLPFTGTAVEWAATHPVFDPKTTPSRSGLLTELFRRWPGVIRSLHPTHAVAAWGSRAPAFCQNHPHAATPCGAGSPYAGLLTDNGKILLLGTDIEAMTFFHTAEELLEPQLPLSPFTRDRYELQVRAGSGAPQVIVTRLFDPAISRKRRIARLIPELQRRHAWHEARLGGAVLVRLDAREVLSALTDMAAQGVYCYEF